MTEIKDAKMDIKSINDYRTRLLRRKRGHHLLRHFDEIVAIANTITNTRETAMDDKSIFKEAERVFSTNRKIIDETERAYRNALLANVDVERALENYEKADMAEREAWDSKQSIGT